MPHITMAQKIIPHSDLLPFDLFVEDFPIEIDLVYSDASHVENIFGQIYHPKARISGHIDLLRLVLLAARRLHAEWGWTLVIKDCLRPIDAQARMIQTPIVRSHPHWLEEPRFLSSPGGGGHPRGMAVDVTARDEQGLPVDFGTRFDYFSDHADSARNSAHRLFSNLSSCVRSHRNRLESAMRDAAKSLNLPILPLPQEWWDFRFPSSFWEEYAPLAEADLPPALRMLTPEDTAKEAGWTVLAKKIREELSSPRLRW